MGPRFRGDDDEGRPLALHGQQATIEANARKNRRSDDDRGVTTMQEAARAAGLTHEITGLERQTMARVSRRLLPMLILCYFVAYLDRVNVGFASLTMNKALGFTSAVYGFGGGIFFIGYFIFEVPSNILLSARSAPGVWIARILITWGIISGCTALVSGPVSFYSVRFVLGLAEAGFFPGIILYLTWWFPSYYRSRIVGMFMAAIPLSNILGSIVSGFLLDLDGWMGIAGWQWLFILEAAPAVVLGVVFWVTMTDWPSEAHWLAPAQRDWLMARLTAERDRREAIRSYSLTQALTDKRVLLLSPGVFRRHVLGLRHRIVPAADRAPAGGGFRHDRHHQRDPLCVRRLRDGAVGAPLRPHRRTSAPRGHRLLHRRDRTDRDGADDRSDPDHDHAGDRLDRRVLYRPNVLEPADGNAVRHRGGGWHRADQRPGQSGRLLRPLPVWADQGRHRRQLHVRADRAGAGADHVGLDRSDAGARSAAGAYSAARASAGE